MRVIVGMIAAVVLAGTASASNWVTVSNSQDGDVNAIDVTTMVHVGTTWTFWMRTNFGKVAANGGTSLTSRIVVDCTMKTEKYLQYSEHTADGAQVSSWQAPGYQAAEAIVPDTVLDVASQAVCSPKP